MPPLPRAIVVVEGDMNDRALHRAVPLGDAVAFVANIVHERMAVVGEGQAVAGQPLRPWSYCMMSRRVSKKPTSILKAPPLTSTRWSSMATT
jgi:hypothetical protein